LANASFAQTGSEHCRLILQNGLYKTFKVTKSGNFNQDIKSYLVSSTFKQDLRNGNWEGNVGVVVEGVPISIGAGASDQEIATFQQRISTATSFAVSESFYEQVRIAVPDVEIARAYTECLEGTAEYGFKVLPTINERDVIFIVTYKKQNTVDQMPRVVLFDLKNGTNVQKPFNVGDLLQDSNAITADRNPERDLSLILQTDKGSVVYRVPAESSGFNKDIPVGTIITSYLNWTEFQSITQNNANNPAGPFWTARYSKWAPSDGRPVPASKFQTAASQPNVPDLRGTFIRGLNSFDPGDEPTPVDPARKDPETRARGSYQPESFKEHRHSGRTGDDAPDHTHGFGGYPYGASYGGDNTAMNLNVSPNGFHRQTDGANTRHTHAISPEGGAETRPKNVAIYFYIRIN
jgi:hypothetical protein